MEHRAKLTSREFGALSRFKGRFDFAHDLRSLNLLELKSASADAYFVLTKVGLAYSAVEALQGAIGKSTFLKLNNPTAQEAIARGELAALIGHLHRAAAAQARPNAHELEVYLDGKCDANLLPLVKHARHVMFHGAVTPNTVKLAGSKTRRQLLLTLALETLAMTERELIGWLNKTVAAR